MVLGCSTCLTVLSNASIVCAGLACAVPFSHASQHSTWCMVHLVALGGHAQSLQEENGSIPLSAFPQRNRVPCSGCAGNAQGPAAAAACCSRVPHLACLTCGVYSFCHMLHVLQRTGGSTCSAWVWVPVLSAARAGSLCSPDVQAAPLGVLCGQHSLLL